MTEDVQIVQWGHGVIRDTAVERQRRQEAQAARDGEPFTATTDCPKCGKWDTHWLSEPRLMPVGDEPMAVSQRKLDMLFSTWREGPTWDPPGSTVARTCTKCDYRWAQA